MKSKTGVAALAFILLGAGGLPADPSAAFSTARDAWPVASYPRYATYATVITFRIGSQGIQRTWRTVEDLQRRVVHADSFSNEEEAHPYVPHGINVGMGGVTSSRDQGGSSLPSGIQQPDAKLPPGAIMNNDPSADPFGMLTFAVNQDWGISRRAPQISTSTDATDVGGPEPALPRIGGTGAEAKIYTVTSLGTTTENGVALVHLGLQPLKDPKRYRLRELWLDPTTQLPVHAIVQGIANHDPLDTVKWRVDYKILDGVPYIDKETALEPISTENGEADDVTITFTDLKTMHLPTAAAQVGLTADQGTTDP
ncbi:MAG TPA: hypothetical protein VMA36_03170 [Candidatus Limnocylindria bacterium]|jgi:hypothetical protein|nr:hypothetical protein [Candidatus Limnocylindria bacterium]